MTDPAVQEKGASSLGPRRDSVVRCPMLDAAPKPCPRCGDTEGFPSAYAGAVVTKSGACLACGEADSEPLSLRFTRAVVWWGVCVVALAAVAGVIFWIGWAARGGA